MAPKGHSTRPTADRVRQALFNVLEHAAWAPPLAGARVADLFAGSGALGLEALSRGAASCVFVDRDAEARRAIAENIASLRLADRSEILAGDATRLANRDGSAKVDLVFLDPPYTEGMIPLALETLSKACWLADRAVAVAEIGAREKLASPANYTVLDERVWGSARVVFLRHA